EVDTFVEQVTSIVARILLQINGIFSLSTDRLPVVTLPCQFQPFIIWLAEIFGCCHVLDRVLNTETEFLDDFEKISKILHSIDANDPENEVVLRHFATWQENINTPNKLTKHVESIKISELTENFLLFFSESFKVVLVEQGSLTYVQKIGLKPLSRYLFARNPEILNSIQLHKLVDSHLDLDDSLTNLQLDSQFFSTSTNKETINQFLVSIKVWILRFRSDFVHTYDGPFPRYLKSINEDYLKHLNKTLKLMDCVLKKAFDQRNHCLNLFRTKRTLTEQETETTLSTLRLLMELRNEFQDHREKVEEFIQKYLQFVGFWLYTQFKNVFNFAQQRRMALNEFLTAEIHLHTFNFLVSQFSYPLDDTSIKRMELVFSLTPIQMLLEERHMQLIKHRIRQIKSLLNFGQRLRNAVDISFVFFHRELLLTSLIKYHRNGGECLLSDLQLIVSSACDLNLQLRNTYPINTAFDDSMSQLQMKIVEDFLQNSLINQNLFLVEPRERVLYFPDHCLFIDKFLACNFSSGMRNIPSIKERKELKKQLERNFQLAVFVPFLNEPRMNSLIFDDLNGFYSDYEFDLIELSFKKKESVLKMGKDQEMLMTQLESIYVEAESSLQKLIDHDELIASFEQYSDGLFPKMDMQLLAETVTAMKNGYYRSKSESKSKLIELCDMMTRIGICAALQKSLCGNAPSSRLKLADMYENDQNWLIVLLLVVFIL
ncbi:hypothetical protein Ciccas_011352, partial [Cichlidogyrus casuarinus]